MTLPDLITALWQARVVLALRGTEPKVVRGPVTRELLAELVEHRSEIIDLLKGVHGAKLEGLECGTCFPVVVPESKIEAEKTALRWCEACRWATAHYPRRPC